MSALACKRNRTPVLGLLVVGILLLLLASLLVGCAAAQQYKPGAFVPEGEHDPAVWGERYPEVYQRWLATADERPAGMSLYKRGFDGGVMYDKLSEYPFMPLLFKGLGFGIEYNEPRGHYYMLIDQQEIDPARVKAGGACLTCKSPYAADLYEEDKQKLFGATYSEAVAMLPQEHRQLGGTCIDCHDNATLECSTRRWTLDAALSEIGVAKDDLSRHQGRLLVCAQCHCTYSVMKDGDKVVDVDLPWEGSKWGAITVENIIAALESQEPRLEWKQEVTGFKLGFIRHPEFEFYSAGSPHFEVGATCSDCHMPKVNVDGKVIADHNLMSPLKQDVMSCRGCHPKSTEELRAQVLAIQERTLGMFIGAGYRVATVAKLIQVANASLDTTAGEPAYDQAAKHYRQAFYRVLYMGAENSVGFHNPGEAVRILTDANAEVARADALLRKLLTAKGVKLPKEVPLDLGTYLHDRGVRKLGFRLQDHIPDPSGVSQKTWRISLGALVK